MVKLKELRKNAVAELERLENDSPVADVDYILTHLLNIPKTDIILGEKNLDKDEIDAFSGAINRLKQGEPVQYIAGGCEFMSLWFQVNKSTLIPRADTEILVESIIDRFKDRNSVEILEIGTGSGCISVSLAHYLKNAKVTAIDISKDALKTAETNAKRLGVDDRCRFFEWDIMKGFPTLESSPHVVVSNPPYIPKADIDGLDKKVKEFEPLTALDGGDDGLVFYRQISDISNLASGGIIAFEVGIGQADDVAKIMEKRFFDIEIIFDLNRVPRVVLGKYSPDK